MAERNRTDSAQRYHAEACLVRRLAGLAVCALLASLWGSCGSGENRITRIAGPSDTVAVHDTTVLHDTTVVWDTARVVVPSGEQRLLYFGLVYDLAAQLSSSKRPFDSSYVSLTTFSDPMRTDLKVTVNAEVIGNESGQSSYIVNSSVSGISQGDLYKNLNMFALLNGALYEGFVKKAARYSFVVARPVYPADTSKPVTYDTVQSGVSMPPVIDTLRFSSPDGVYRPLPDSLGGYVEFRADKNLTTRWPRRADFYSVVVGKIIVYQGTVYPVGAPVDTLLTDTTFTVTPAFFSTPDDTSDDDYDGIEVDVVPINGPLPAQWDTMPSFGSAGLLLAFRSDYAVELLAKAKPGKPLGKSAFMRLQRPGRQRTGLDIVAGMLREMGGR